MNNQATSFLRKLLSPRVWAYALFWSWNIIFLAFMVLGFAPSLLPEMITAVRANAIPTTFLVYATLLTIIPLLAVILGLTILRRSPGRLLTLGYGVEAPLMLMLAIRFFVVRDMTPSVALLLAMGTLGIATLLWQLLDRNIEARGPVPAHLRVVGLTLLLLVGLYAAAWLAFYAVPLAAQSGEILTNLVDNGRSSLDDLDWRWLPFWVLGIILVAYSATLFIIMPIAVPILYLRAWWRGVRTLGEAHGWPRPAALTAVVLAACAILFVQTNHQPQHLAFKLLETPPATPAEAQALLDRQGAIRSGLLNAYLAPVRYVSAVGEVRHVRVMYERALDMPPTRAHRVQRAYETMARPVLYTPVNPPSYGPRADPRTLIQEPLEAAELYETFFDESIIDGERETIVRAVRSTWSIDQAQAAWQAIDDREVLLTWQEVTVAENGDWAEVELYEVYQNQTGQRQEVVYYFSLPESAVITGVWLGNSPERDARFSYRVSPRGAAQALYRNEVDYSRDPALVEQIGPRQYRLRIFPIQPQSLRRDNASGHSLVEAGPPLHMWLTWRVLARDNAWPLPRLAERRNVYWDDTTVRLLNGEPVAIDKQAWLPLSVPATSPVNPVSHRVDFPGGKTVLVHPVSAVELPELPDKLRLALVLDRSRSMAKRGAEVKRALAGLDAAVGPDATVDVYLTASRYRGEDPALVSFSELDPDSIVYFGGQNAAELLAQFDLLKADKDYDAMLVLTDGSGYELGASDIDVPAPDTPVWMVHLGGDFPLGYDDATLEAIQASGGGVTGGIDEAMTRIATAIGSDRDAAPTDVIDGYTWLTIPSETAAADDAVVVHTASDDFAALAARRLILDTMERERKTLKDMSTLDRMHAIAVDQGIVTPYSSMIVLVNQAQQNRLDRLEALNDRFQREHEVVGETISQNPFSVTGVPEPEEWLLLALAGAMLAWYARTRVSSTLIRKPGD